MDKNKTGLLLLALVTFAVLMIELLLAKIIEPAIFRKQMNEWSDSQRIVHWIITSCIWIVLSLFTIRYARNNYQIDFLQKTQPMALWQILLIAFLMIIKFYVSYKSWEGFKVLKEFNNLGMPKFVFQYIYYCAEVLLVTLILMFGQLFFEKLFNNSNIPYGGILLAITWGIGHFFTKDYMTGILSTLVGFAFGSVYLLTNHNFVLTYILVWIMFVL